MRYAGIDYGSKRIGIAVSDPDGRIAFPQKTLLNRGIRKMLADLRSLIQKEKIEAMIVGLPISMDGTETAQTQEVRRFIETMKKNIPISVETENEMLTSRMAAADGMEGGHIDASSAAIILQSYLDRKTLSTKL